MATSTIVKRRYNEKTYLRVQASLPKGLVQTLREEISKDDDMHLARLIKDAIEKYLLTRGYTTEEVDDMSGKNYIPKGK
ncbi:MAG: hypothetical protein FWG40_00540 [Peptococcaceae bacterium]|nr:hypothetical protein [Peptococcaceae bacterium]